MNKEYIRILFSIANIPSARPKAIERWVPPYAIPDLSDTHYTLWFRAIIYILFKHLPKETKIQYAKLMVANRPAYRSIDDIFSALEAANLVNKIIPLTTFKEL